MAAEAQERRSMNKEVSLQVDAEPHTSVRDRLWARYRDDDLADRLSSVPWSDALDTMLSHRSIRSYLDKPIAPETLELLIAAAQSAPTTSNLQAWSVIAIRDPERKARLAAIAGNQRHVAKAPLVLAFVADLARLRSISADRDHPGLALDYIEAFIFAIADASFAAQNTLMAAESIGLGGCYIGALRNNPAAVADELGVPDGAMVVFGMTIGYPDPAVDSDVKPRLPQGVVLHEERYSPAPVGALAEYDRRMQTFQTEQNMRAIEWTEQSALRVRDEAALTGRHVLKDFLAQRGFSLR
jgi:nitroreductase